MNRVHSDASSVSIPVELRASFPITAASLGRLRSNLAYLLVIWAFRVDGNTASAFVLELTEAALSKKDTTHDR